MLAPTLTKGIAIMDKPLFTIKFKYFGIRFDWSNDANRRKVLSAVIWYPKSTKRLGYFYPSITF